MSLDTKYRPRTYDELLGQSGAIKTLRGIVSEGAGWKQSYLFAGPFGSGKTTLGEYSPALFYAKTLMMVTPAMSALLVGG